jgi:hypothetical protein
MMIWKRCYSKAQLEAPIIYEDDLKNFTPELETKDEGKAVEPTTQSNVPEGIPFDEENSTGSGDNGRKGSDVPSSD